ncbi:MAG: alpha/beta hydrolase [Jatrophihabitantaceae bacterium]
MTDETVGHHVLAPGRPGAPLVVFAHGLEDSWKSWGPLAAALDPAWRKVALDLPWRPGNDYRWRNRALGQWLGSGLDQLDAVPDLLVAHSLGANAALELMCALDPRPGRAIALVCPVYRLRRHQVSWRMFDRAREAFVQHTHDSVRVGLGARAGAFDPDVLKRMVKTALDRIGPAGFLTVFDQFVESADLALENVDRPTLVIAGGADATLSREAATALAAGMPGARLDIGEEYDHFCHVRHARAVAGQVAELLDAGQPSAPTRGEYR